MNHSHQSANWGPSLTRRQAFHSGVLSAAGMTMASRLIAADVEAENSDSVKARPTAKAKAVIQSLARRWSAAHRHV